MDHMAGSRPEILKISSTSANFFFIKVLHPPSLSTIKRFHLWETMLEEIWGLCKSNSAFPFMTCNRKLHLFPSSLKECQGHRLQKKCPSPYYIGKKKYPHREEKVSLKREILTCQACKFHLQFQVALFSYPVLASSAKTVLATHL